MKSLNQLMLGSKAAVIVVDVQNDYCHPDGALPRAGCDVSGVAEMMPQLHKLLHSARELNVPIIFIQTLHEGDGFRGLDDQVLRTLGSCVPEGKLGSGILRDHARGGRYYCQ